MTKSNVREGGLIVVHSLTTTWQQEQEAAGRAARSQGQRMNYGPELTFLIQSRTAAHGMMLPIFRMGLSISIKPI